MTPLISFIAISCYLLCSLLLTLDLIKEKSNYRSTYLGWLGLCLHFAYLTSTALQAQQLDFSFFNIGSSITFIIALLLLLASITKPVEKLGIGIFPITALMLGLSVFFPGKEHTLHDYSWQMGTHILSSIIAFSLLNIAALQAILLAIQDQQLKSHHPKKIINSLPPLQTMESLLFQMIGTGILFLSISLISGFIFIEDLFAQHLVHKTVLSILAWIIFTGLLFGRIRYGWRGQTAIKWTLTGFTLLLLAYFGSKLVLELILKQ